MSKQHVFHQAYEEWCNGRMTPREALRAMLSDVQEIDSDLKPMEEEKAGLRELMCDIAMTLDAPFECDGIEIAYVQPSQTSSYDKKAVDDVVHALITSGQHELAAQLAAAKKESVRSGFLRIGPGKPKRKTMA